MSRAKELALNLATAATTLLAAGAIGFRFWHQPVLATPPLAPRSVTEWRRYADFDDERIGPRSASVTITEFADFQCPFCRKAAGDLATVLARHPSDVALVFRNDPLDIHRYAMGAARAAACAARQHAFPAYYDQLFAHADSIGRIPWTRFARSAGVARIDAFDACIGDTLNFPELDRDTADATRLGVIGTPTLLINDLLVSGNPGLDSLEHLVAAKLPQTRP